MGGVRAGNDEDDSDSDNEPVLDIDEYENEIEEDDPVKVHELNRFTLS